MPRDHTGSNRDQSEYYGALQRLVDSLFPDEDDAVAPDAARPAGAADPAGAAGAGSAGPDGAGVPGTAAEGAWGAGDASAADAAAAFGVSERTASLLGLAALVPPAAPSSDPEARVPAGTPVTSAAPSAPTIRRLDAVLAAEAADLPDDLILIVKLLPPGDYTRARLCTQLNSALTGHAWGQVYGTVE